MPGGYDFARVAYYEGIGAVGFAYGAAKPADIGPAPLAIRLAEPLAHLRDTIRRRIEAALPGDSGHLAAALVIGDRARHLRGYAGGHARLRPGAICWRSPACTWRWSPAPPSG